MREQIRVVLTVARDPVLARVELAFLGFKMAESATWMAIMVYGYLLGGAAMAGIVALVQLVPAGLVAPIAAAAADRFRPDRVLLAAYLIIAAAFAATAVALYAGAAVPVTLATATLAAAAITLVRPIEAVILPSITHRPADLTAANTVSSLAETAGIFLGPFLAGVLLVREQPADVFAAFTVVMLLGGLLVAGIRLEDARPVLPTGLRDVVTSTLGGFDALARERPVLLVVIVLGASAIVVGCLDVLFAAVAIDLLHLGPSWAGYLSAASGLGGILGAATAVSLIGRRRLTPAIAGSGTLYGLPLVAIGALTSVAAAPVLFAMSGAGASLCSVAGRTLLQRAAPERVIGRVFGVLEGLSMLAMAAGSLAVGLVVGAWGVPAGLLIAGLVVPLTLVATWRELGALDRHARPPDPAALELLRGLAIFRPLSAPAIERILADLEWRDVPAGATVIRQGELGDRFYVIASGRAVVTIDGVTVSERGVGEGFGEIALLRNVPRTATVVALTPLRLLAIERSRFLEAVTGHLGSRTAAEAVAEAQLAAASPAGLRGPEG